MASWSASSACWLGADRGRTISIPTVLKIQHPDPEKYWSELCSMHSDLWFNSLCFPPSTLQCILVFRTVSLTASANQNAAVTPTWAFKPCTGHDAMLLFEQGQHLESACVEIVALNFAVSFPSPVLSHHASRQQSINANHKWRWVGQLYQQNKSQPVWHFKSLDGFLGLIFLLPDHQLYVDLQKTNHTFLKIWMKIGIHAHWLFWGHGNVIEHLKYPGHRQMSTLRWLSYYGNQINTKPKLNPNKSRAREDPNPTEAAAKWEREGIFRRKGRALCRPFEMPRGEFLTSGRSGSAGPPGWARRSAGSARSPRPRCFCSLPPWGSAGRSNAGGCAWNWRHLEPWGCLSSLNNAGKGNKISFDCTDTKQEFLFVILFSGTYNCEIPTRSYNTVTTWAESLDKIG